MRKNSRRQALKAVVVTLVVGSLQYSAPEADACWKCRKYRCRASNTSRILVLPRRCMSGKCCTSICDSKCGVTCDRGVSVASEPIAQLPNKVLVERIPDPSLSGLFSNTGGQVAANKIDPQSKLRLIHTLQWYGFYHNDPLDTVPIKFSIRFLESESDKPDTTAIHESTVHAQVRDTDWKVTNRGPQRERRIFKFHVDFQSPIKLVPGSSVWLSIAEDDGTHGQWLWCDAEASGTFEMSFENQYPTRIAPWRKSKMGRSSAFSLYGKSLE